MNRSGWLKLVLIAAVAQLTASAVFVSLMALYGRTHAGDEAWPFLIPALAAAFALEIVILFFALRHQRRAAFLFKISMAVLASWVAGLAGFLVLDVFARSLLSKPPLFAWLLGLAMLLVMLRRAERTWVEIESARPGA